MLGIFKDDPGLKAHEDSIMPRIRGYREWKTELKEKEGGLEAFATGYNIYGFHRDDVARKWTFTEWLPAAKQAFLTGEFNGWSNENPMRNSGFGRWTVDLPDEPDGSWAVPHRSQIRVRVEGEFGQWFDRVPAWAKLAWQDAGTLLFNGVFWEPPKAERYVMRNPRPPRPDNLKVYEAHVGMSSIEPRVATYLEFKENVLPRIKRLGYNAVQLMAIAEHAHYGSFGYHVTSFFAPSSRSGTPEELKEMIDAAHGMGIIVLMDLVHAHCSSNQMDGIAAMDGTDHCYTHGGAKGKQEQWDSSLFHYTKWEVLRFLLSNCRWWLEEYGFDGFRFDGVTSMLYHSHGIGKGYSGGYHEYFGLDADIESHIYLMLANDLIHRLLPNTAITVAEDVSGMPTLCRPTSDGGFGFDYRLSMAVPDMWIKILKECSDDQWNMGHIAHTLQNRRWKEKCIAYAESHDQAIVGDKTVAFWLMDAEMYTHMSTLGPSSMVIDRGLALHKMIRLITLGLGGEGYLNFVGNEFGHPEWVDFPREGNGWSYRHCRRRFDLPDTDHLKFKYFEAFDEVMQALENRFKFLSSEHQFCSRSDEMDKVFIFERGDCLFVFNFHPTNSYTDYRIGHPWNEGLKVVVDSDEGRFGGFMRLEHGHANAFPVGKAWDNRYHSAQLYLPARTVQVLVRESLLNGGITVKLAMGSEAVPWSVKPSDLRIALVSPEGEVLAGQSFPVDLDYAVNFDASAITFKILQDKGGQLVPLPFGPPVYKAYFPGDYLLDGNGNFQCLGGAGAPPPPKGDGVPRGCTSIPGCGGQKVQAEMRRSMTPTLLAPSEMPEDTAAADNIPDYVAVQTMEARLSPLQDADTATGTGSPPSTGTSPTPVVGVTQNVPDYLSDCGSEAGKLTRVTSLSALDSLLTDPEEKLELRRGMEEMGSDRYEGRNIDTPIVIVSSEVNPWSKTGGLAAVAGSYGYEFAQRGHRTMVVSPRYGEFENCTYIGYAKVWLDGREHEVGYFHQRQDYGGGKGADYIFVQHVCYHRPAGLYWDPAAGKEYGDNLFRFALLSVAALEAPLILNLGGSTYGQDVVFIANDWQAGLVPTYMTYKYRRNNTYRNARCIFVIHNIGYQGKYPYSKFPIDEHLGLPIEAMEELQGEDLNLGLDCLNLLSNAIKLSDRVLTVSPNYANEIQSPEGGQGLHEILQWKGAQLRLGGILNGISDEWNPRTDPHIPCNYTLNDFEEGKAKCKAELQRSLGLHCDPNVALVGFCGRLCYQKGVQLITAITEWLMRDEGNGVTGRVQLICMGKGEEKYSNDLRQLEGQNRGRVCGYVGFDPRVEHKMMAGCDFLLMPSQYEPCGLPQMYAQQYGTLPIVHETGGLKDSVKGLWDDVRDRPTATGFLFSGFDENKLKERIYQALEIFHKRKDLFRQMQVNAIRCDYYWPRVIDEYERHIDWTMDAQPCKC
mmetsp:Transcript_66966/g.160397  ORF Transcript_66966/g.160397 Transcript_66966/m.160397 type:complete len:1446 (+) Transcript_66966:129-4466(+)